ncbi:MAG: RCC1 domain-containing protein, partial [Egibacteraceae bacterium]
MTASGHRHLRAPVRLRGHGRARPTLVLCGLALAGALVGCAAGDTGPDRANDEARVAGGALSADAGTDGAITAGGRHTCMLDEGGTVACWGNNLHGEVGDGTTTDRRVPVAVAGLDDA